ncbi:MAG: dTDP-4-dehydrorhamnose 3,5-epimerase [Bacteroidales bacterium]
MLFKELEISGAFIIEPQKFGDARGYFLERYRKSVFDREIGAVDFIQDNQSCSTRGVLRGLHYQKGEFSQAKLVWVLSGRVLDIAVDLRRSSKTFGRYLMEELSDENNRMLFIPRGFAHGFMVLSEMATFAYKADNLYSPDHEESIRYNDPTIGVRWPLREEELVLSDKDRNGKLFTEVEYFD